MEDWRELKGGEATDSVSTTCRAGHGCSAARPTTRTHYTDSSPTEKLRMADIVGDVSNLSDDESPRHGLVEDEKQLALSEADKAFKAMMCLLEYDRFEEMCKLLGELGEALRDAKPASTDASMPEETESHRARRYTQCGQSETSDTDYRADVNYGPADQHEPEPDGDENKEMES